MINFITVVGVIIYILYVYYNYFNRSLIKMWHREFRYFYGLLCNRINTMLLHFDQSWSTPPKADFKAKIKWYQDKYSDKKPVLTFGQILVLSIKRILLHLFYQIRKLLIWYCWFWGHLLYLFCTEKTCC